MILFIDEDIVRSCAIAAALSSRLNYKESVQPLPIMLLKDFFDAYSFRNEPRLLVCIHANYQDFVKTRTRGHSRFGLEEFADHIREERPQSRIIVYAGIEHPTDQILTEFKPDGFICDDNITYINKLIRSLQDKQDVTPEEMAERGIRVEMLETGERVGKQFIHHEREGD